MAIYTFDVTELPTLNINSSCEAIITYTPRQIVEVEVTGSDSDEVKVSQSNNQINIFSENLSGSGVTSIFSGSGSTYIQSISGGVVIGGSKGGINISGVSGKVVINGQEIDLSKTNDGKRIEPTKIIVKAPLCLLDLEVKGHCAFDAKNAKIDDASVVIQGGGQIDLNTKNLDLSISGSCDANVTGIDGSLSVLIAGSADVEASGRFSSVTAQISGSGDVNTNGACLGNYKAQISGSGDIRHLGIVQGKIRKTVSGSGSIRGLDG